MKAKKLTVMTLVAGVVGGLVYAARRATGRPTGELASTPTDLSWASWRRALLETKDAFGNKNLSIYAAGIAYFGVLAFFPLVAAIVGIAGLALKPTQMADAFKNLSQYLPHDVAALFTSQLQAAVGHHASSLLLVIVGILLSIWGVAGAMQNMMSALNVSYDVKESRHFMRLKLVSIGLTIGAIFGGLLLGAVFVSGTGTLKQFGLPSAFVDLFSWLRWVFMAAGAVAGLSILYRFGPNRRPTRRWQWVSWGALVATTTWIVASVLFFAYLQYFGNFAKSYSTFAGIVGLMMWLNISALVVLLGAEVNHRLEQKTAVPTYDKL